MGQYFVEKYAIEGKLLTVEYTDSHIYFNAVAIERKVFEDAVKYLLDNHRTAYFEKDVYQIFKLLGFIVIDEEYNTGVFAERGKNFKILEQIYNGYKDI